MEPCNFKNKTPRPSMSGDNSGTRIYKPSCCTEIGHPFGPMRLASVCRRSGRSCAGHTDASCSFGFHVVSSLVQSFAVREFKTFGSPGAPNLRANPRYSMCITGLRTLPHLRHSTSRQPFGNDSRKGQTNNGFKLDDAEICENSSLSKARLTIWFAQMCQTA